MYSATWSVKSVAHNRKAKATWKNLRLAKKNHGTNYDAPIDSDKLIGKSWEMKRKTMKIIRLYACLVKKTQNENQIK